MMIETGVEPLPARATDEHARRTLRTACRGEQVIVVANRQPLRHDFADGAIVAARAHSGVVHAVEPLLAACSGVWVGHGAGSADRVMACDRDGLGIPPEQPAYRLRRVWMSTAEERGYYDGFANEGLWPLCHRAYVKPVFRASDFTAYKAINRRFAAAACNEAQTDSPLVLVQDYHFALVPQAVREWLPHSLVVTFWHIPWPHEEEFDICPFARQILDGLLGSSIVGFQTVADCTRFLDTVERFVTGVSVDRVAGAIKVSNRRVLVRAYPASIEWPPRLARAVPAVEQCRTEIRQQLGLPPQAQLGVSVDRLDYTKGLEEKFSAIERLLDEYPGFRPSFAFVQLAQPTRARLPAYRELRPRLLAIAGRINEKFGTADHRLLTLLEGDHAPEDVFRYFRAADLCYVASLQDGMNLVSKEFVSARDDERGVLVLSRFAGAAAELAHALLVNPWDIDGTAATLVRALRMSAGEQRLRMCGLRSAVAQYSAHRWAQEMITDALRLRSRPGVSRPASSDAFPAAPLDRRVVRFDERRSDARP